MKFVEKKVISEALIFADSEKLPSILHIQVLSFLELINRNVFESSKHRNQ